MDDVTKALERLEQKWREDAQKPGDGYDGAAYNSGVQETLLNCADELATLRQSLAGQGEVVAVAWRYKDAGGHFRYSGNRPTEPAFSYLKPVPLYTTPRPAESEWLQAMLHEGVPEAVARKVVAIIAGEV